MVSLSKEGAPIPIAELIWCSSWRSLWV